EAQRAAMSPLRYSCRRHTRELHSFPTRRSSDLRGSRRAARRAGTLVGQTQGGSDPAVAARRGSGNPLARTGGNRRDPVRLAGSVSGRRRSHLRAREADVENEETQRLKSLVADLSMSNELLREKIHRLEAARPLAWRRSKP